MNWWNLILKALASAGAFFATHWKPIAGLLSGWIGRGLVEDNKQLKTKVDGLENERKQIARYNDIKNETSRLSDDELRKRMRNLH